MAYEMNPSAMIIGLMVFAPFVIGLTTAITVGWGGVLGLVGLAVVSTKMDGAPKASSRKPPPPPEIPAVES